MKKILPFIVLSLFFFSACAGSKNDSREPNAFAQEIHNTPELLDIDTSLDEMEAEIADINSDYDKIQEKILPNADFNVKEDEKVEQLEIVLNENTVLSVNQTAMSKNDFTAYADRVLPDLCHPNPKLSIHKKADYDTASWILDVLYSHGCLDVTIE